MTFMYDVNTDELLFELFCRAVYKPSDIAELRRMYEGLSNKGKSEVRKACGALGQLLGGWQPVETAPKDGTNFLACSPASSVFFAHWANGVVDSSSWIEGYGYQRRYATHWMPLPEPV